MNRFSMGFVTAVTVLYYHGFSSEAESLFVLLIMEMIHTEFICLVKQTSDTIFHSII